MIDDLPYRRLTNNGVTLIVRDLQPMRRKDNHHDVNGDGEVTPLDALVIINQLNRMVAPSKDLANLVRLTASNDADLPDVSGDNQVSALDALLVINELARLQTPPSASPEAPSTPQVDIERESMNENDVITEQGELF